MAEYRWKLKKRLFIFIAAILAGIFFQFSVDKRPVSEQDFIFKASPPPFLKDSAIWADSVFLSKEPIPVKCSKSGFLIVEQKKPEIYAFDLDFDQK